MQLQSAGAERRLFPQPHKPTVTKRTMLREGDVVEIKVPKGAQMITTEFDDKTITYALFHRTVRGGKIAFHVRGDNPEQHLNKRLRVKAEIWCKKMSDGQEYLYVDLYPTTDQEATKKLLVQQFQPASIHPDGWLIFKPAVRSKMHGAICLIPPEQEVVDRVGTFVPAPVESTPSSSGPRSSCAQDDDDPQLSRLLQDGWQIINERDDEVDLGRTDKRGDYKTMTQPRQKKGRKKNK